MLIRNGTLLVVTVFWALSTVEAVTAQEWTMDREQLVCQSAQNGTIPIARTH
jgi:hypothetical protein